MLETNHVRAALLKSLPLFLINTQIIYRSKCNRKTHTLVGWAKHVLGQWRKRACCFAQTNPYQQTNLEGRGKACAMTRKWNRQRYILLWQPFQLKTKQKTKQNWPQAIFQLVQPTYQCNDIIYNLTPFQKVHQPRRKAERCSDAALWGIPLEKRILANLVTCKLAIENMHFWNFWPQRAALGTQSKKVVIWKVQNTFLSLIKIEICIFWNWDLLICHCLPGCE